MKKYISLLLVVITICCSFVACSSKSDTKTTKVYYDRNGVEYTQFTDVMYYTKDGEAYKLEIVDDYMPDYVNQSTGEHLNGFYCYISSDGYLYYSEELKRKDGTTDTYLDQEGNAYYDINTVSWDSTGKMNK